MNCQSKMAYFTIISDIIIVIPDASKWSVIQLAQGHFNTTLPGKEKTSRLHSKNKWCSEGPYRVIHVVPNTGPYLVLQGTPIEGASKDPHYTVLWSTPKVLQSTHKVLQSTPHKVLPSTPIVALGHPVLTCIGASDLFILWHGGPSGHLYLAAGASWYLIQWVIGTSRLEGALRDLTQFGVLCSVTGGVNLWCHWCIMLSKQTN